MFEFEFMQRTMLVGLMLSISIPLIGIVMVNRRTAMMGDALSHTSLAGVGLGLIAGFNPVAGAILMSVVAAFVIEAIRKKMPQYGDLATAVTMSSGLGLAVILSDFAPGGRSFESYLFGSISAVTGQDLLATTVMFVLVVGASAMFYGSLLDMAVDPVLAKLSGTRVDLVNAVFTALAAITVALAAKVIGALLVISLMVLPVATALITARSYRRTFLTSIILGVIYTTVGITLSFYFDIRPGGAIVVCAAVGMAVFGVVNKLVTMRSKTDTESSDPQAEPAVKVTTS